MLFWPRTNKVAVMKREQVEEHHTQPDPEEIKPVDSEELQTYTALCKKIDAETPAVRMLQLRQFLANRGIPEYDLSKVDEHLKGLAKQKGENFEYEWYPLRKDDQCERFQAWRSQVLNSGCTGNQVYNKIVPQSVLETVATILEAFPDARFFVSDFSIRAKISDPFLLVAFPGVEPLAVDFWNEPNFRQ